VTTWQHVSRFHVSIKTRKVPCGSARDLCRQTYDPLQTLLVFLEPELNSDYRWHVGLIGYIIGYSCEFTACVAFNLYLFTVKDRSMQRERCNNRHVWMPTADRLRSVCGLYAGAGRRGPKVAPPLRGRTRWEAAALIYNCNQTNSCSTNLITDGYPSTS